MNSDYTYSPGALDYGTPAGVPQLSATPNQVHGPLESLVNGKWVNIPAFSSYGSTTSSGVEGSGGDTLYYDQSGNPVTDPLQQFSFPGGSLISNVNPDGTQGSLYGTVGTGQASPGGQFMDNYGGYLTLAALGGFAGAGAAAASAGAGIGGGAAASTGELGSLGATGSVGSDALAGAAGSAGSDLASLTYGPQATGGLDQLAGGTYQGITDVPVGESPFTPDYGVPADASPTYDPTMSGDPLNNVGLDQQGNIYQNPTGMPSAAQSYDPTMSGDPLNNGLNKFLPSAPTGSSLIPQGLQDFAKSIGLTPAQTISLGAGALNALISKFNPPAASGTGNTAAQQAALAAFNNPGTGNYGHATVAPLNRTYVPYTGNPLRYGIDGGEHQFFNNVNPQGGQPAATQTGQPVHLASGGSADYDNVNPRLGLSPEQEQTMMAAYAQGQPPGDSGIVSPILYARGGLSMVEPHREISPLDMLHDSSQMHPYVQGPGGGQDDQVQARLSPKEYVMDADTVASLGDGNPDEGARRLDQMRENIRAHKRAAPVSKIPPKAKAPLEYLRRAA